MASAIPWTTKCVTTVEIINEYSAQSKYLLNNYDRKVTMERNKIPQNLINNIPVCLHWIPLITDKVWYLL